MWISIPAGRRLKLGRKLGQHFLRDKNILKKIVQSAEINENDNVLEIGAGDGALTAFLLMKARKVIACEIDEYLYEKLRNKFRFSENLILTKGDFLKIDFSFLDPSDYPNKVVANIPYYLTTPLIFNLLLKHEIKEIYLTLQKEYAERLIAQPKSESYGAITININVLAEPEIKFFISKNSFSPPPKIDSAFVFLRKREEPLIPYEKFPEFSAFVRKAFSQRRKTLKNALKTLGVKIPEELARKRPEELSVEEFISLFNSLTEKMPDK
jgi:16S rRNA (adenine1518-N6/adenine1519-N6)-dimethyltransferase